MSRFFQPYNPPKCMFCDKQSMWEDTICEDCFRSQQERVPIEERIFMLELGLRGLKRHRHFDPSNTVYG